VVYVALRRAALDTTFGSAAALGVDVVPKLLGAAGVYLGKLILPIRQSAYISDLPSGPVALLLAGAAIALVCGGGVVAWRRGERRVSFLLLWIGVTLAPSLAIVVKIPGAPVAERYLYLPSVGFCLLVGYTASRMMQRVGRVVVTAVVALLLCAGTATSVQRNAVWRSNLTLWTDTAAKNTTDGLPMRGLSTAYQQLGDAAKAAEYFQLALQRRNDQSGQFTIYNNLGSLAMTERKLDEAERYYRKALGLNPQAAECVFNLGLIALTRAKEDAAGHDAAWQREQAQRARQLFEQSIQLNPHDPDAYVALGQTFTTLGDGQAARAHFERALQLGLPPATEASVRRLLTAPQ